MELAVEHRGEGDELQPHGAARCPGKFRRHGVSHKHALNHPLATLCCHPRCSLSATGRGVGRESRAALRGDRCALLERGALRASC